MNARFVAVQAAAAVAAAAALWLVACGGPKSPSAPTVDPASDASAAPDAGTTAAPRGDAGDGALTAAECDLFVDHIVGLAADMRTGEAAATEEEIAATREQLRTEMRPACMQVSREVFECALAARDQAALAACQ